MNLGRLIRELEAWRDELGSDTTVYVREKTRLNGAGWVSPRTIEPGFDPWPLSAANDGTLVVFIS